jgi:hypothetical protein
MFSFRNSATQEYFGIVIGFQKCFKSSHLVTTDYNVQRIALLYFSDIGEWFLKERGGSTLP